MRKWTLSLYSAKYALHIALRLELSIFSKIFISLHISKIVNFHFKPFSFFICVKLFYECYFVIYDNMEIFTRLR